MHNLENILNKLGVGLLLIDRDHRIEWMNEKAREWLGPIKTGERRKCYRTMAYSDSFCAVCPTGKTLTSGTPTRYELNLPQKACLKNHLKTPDKIHQAAFDIIGIPVYSDSNTVCRVMEILLDISDKNKAKIRSAEMMAQIEKMAALGQLAAGIAHELNTPLATISIISQELKYMIDGMLAGEITKNELIKDLDDVQGEIKRCQTIIEDLLSFSKKGVSQPRATDVNDLVSKAAMLIQKGERYRRIRIVKRLNKTIPVVMTEPERFRQVVFNVLKNAIEAVMDKADGCVVVSSEAHDRFVTIAVADNGHGMSRTVLKKIFEPFFTTKPVGRGTGLGLSVSYAIMKDLKGDIKIESRNGKGTKVMLFLPTAIDGLLHGVQP